MANRTLFNVTVESKVFGQKPTSSYRKLLESLMTNLIEDPKTTAKVLGIKLKSQMNIKKFDVEHKTMTISGHTNTMNLKVINRNIERIVDSLITPSGEKYIIKNYVLESMNDKEYSRIHESEALSYILDHTGLRDSFREDFDAAMRKLPYMYSAKSSMLAFVPPTNWDELRLYFSEFGFMEIADKEYLLPMPEGCIRFRVKDYDFDTMSIYIDLFNSMQPEPLIATFGCQLTDCVDLSIITSGFYDNPMLSDLMDLHLAIGRYWAPFVVNNRFYGYRSTNGKKAYVIPTIKETEFKEKFDDLFTVSTLHNYPVAYYKNGKFKRFITFFEFEDVIRKSISKETESDTVVVSDDNEIDEVLDITMPQSYLTTNVLPDYKGTAEDIAQYMSFFTDGILTDMELLDSSVICKTRFNETIIVSTTDALDEEVYVEFIDADTFVYTSEGIKLREIMDLYTIRYGLHHMGLQSISQWLERFYHRYQQSCSPFITDYHMGFYNQKTGEYYCVHFDDSDVNIVFDITHDIHTMDDAQTMSPESMCEYIDKLGE